MDVLIVEPLDSDVRHWLAARHAVQVAPQLAQEPVAFRQALMRARAVVIPPSVALDAATLQMAPNLRIVGRLSAGGEDIDLDACALAGIQVVRPATACAVAEAEFAIGALLQMLRRVPVLNSEGLLVGRELGGATVGIVGMTSSARPLAPLLQAFGAHTVGYDPALHASDPVWQRCGVEPLSLHALMRDSDAVCVLLPYVSRFAGLFGERVLADSKAEQVIVCLSQSGLFDEAALAGAMRSGQLAAVWMDGLEPGALAAGRPLRHIDTLQVTPRIAGTTLQSRTRSAWAVARRIDDVLQATPARVAAVKDGNGGLLRPVPSNVTAGLAGGPAPA